MNNAIQMLIASSNEQFLRRFETACGAASIAASCAADGYEALTRLEHGGIDLLLIDGGFEGINNGLNGIAGHELCHMWRQIEGRSNHLVIGYVTQRDSGCPPVLTAERQVDLDMMAKREALTRIVGSGEDIETTPSRFFVDPVLMARNRGADYHYWSDDDDSDIVSELEMAVRTSRDAVDRAIEQSSDLRITRIADARKRGD